MYYNAYDSDGTLLANLAVFPKSNLYIRIRDELGVYKKIKYIYVNFILRVLDYRNFPNVINRIFWLN